MAVEPGYIARQIFISRVEESPVVFIHSRSTIKDGNFQCGIICGFHVARKRICLVYSKVAFAKILEV